MKTITLEDDLAKLLLEIFMDCDQNGNGFKAKRGRYFAYMNDSRREREFWRDYYRLRSIIIEDSEV
jgi:hypothetical protein